MSSKGDDGEIKSIFGRFVLVSHGNGNRNGHRATGQQKIGGRSRERNSCFCFFHPRISLRNYNSTSQGALASSLGSFWYACMERSWSLPGAGFNGLAYLA
ncbi:hypothetical protein VTL71DRAFT_2718 [Oculimacula yallundae]|uniref:Uncharacterized protein n=1 Tax=Oculimacula yallundae TaxID=86028 RepID=A0ABR4CBK8_9HELO